MKLADVTGAAFTCLAIGAVVTLALAVRGGGDWEMWGAAFLAGVGLTACWTDMIVAVYRREVERLHREAGRLPTSHWEDE